MEKPINMKDAWASWMTVENRSHFRSETCAICGAAAHHIAIVEDDDDAECIRARCRDHFNPLTQKTWLKNWRRQNIKD